eukprot:scaffold2558_cov172-Amphora_coffeaeformis.AAC.5
MISGLAIWNSRLFERGGEVFRKTSLRSFASSPAAVTKTCGAVSSGSTGGVIWMEPIHMLGAGSVGLLMAASLRIAFPSYPIRLLLREHHRINPGNDRPDVLVNLIQNRRLRTVQVPSQIISERFSPKRKFRNILLATKAYQAVDALESIQHCLELRPDSNPTQIVLLCNGAMAVRHDILSNFPDLDPTNLHMALTTHGAYRELATNEASSENDSNYYESATEESSSLMMDVVHAGLGRLDFPSELEAWVPLFDRAGLQAQVLSNEEMQTQLWCKLAANCLINPVSALYQCTNGEVVNTSEWNELLISIPEEVANVARVQLGEKVDVQASKLRQFCEYVVTSTKDNRSSMLQDVKAGRRTEIDSLNGYVTRLGEQSGVCVEANRDLHERVLALQRLKE